MNGRPTRNHHSLGEANRGAAGADLTQAVAEMLDEAHSITRSLLGAADPEDSFG